MKLVNIYKHFLIFFILIGIPLQTVEAQEIWPLEKCIDSALVHNKNIQMSWNDRFQTAYKKLEIQSDRQPRVSLQSDYKYFIDLPHQFMPMSTFDPNAPNGMFREAQFGVPHNINAQIQLMIPVYNPQTKGAIEGADIAREMTEIKHKKSEEELIYDLTMLYYNAQVLLYQKEYIADNKINTEKLLATMRLLYEQQMAKKSDVDKILLQLDQLTTAADKVENQFDKIISLLKLNMGLDSDLQFTVEKEIRFHAPQDYLLHPILDLKLLTAKNNLMQNELRTLDKVRKMPTISGMASYGLNGFGYDKSPNSFLKFHPVGFLGIQAAYPLYDGQKVRFKKEQKKLEIQNNELQSSLLKEKNQVELKNAQKERMTSQKIISDTDSQIELARRVYDQTLLQQKQGTATLSDVLMADQALREVQQDRLSAMVEYLKADLKLKKLSGELSNENNK